MRFLNRQQALIYLESCEGWDRPLVEAELPVFLGHLAESDTDLARTRPTTAQWMNIDPSETLSDKRT